MVSPHAALIAGGRPPRLERASRIQRPGRPQVIPFRLLHEASNALNAAGHDIPAIADTVCRLVVAFVRGGAILSLSDDRGVTLTPIAVHHSDTVTETNLRNQCLGRTIPSPRHGVFGSGTPVPAPGAAWPAGLPLGDVADRVDLDLRIGGRAIGTLTAFRDAGQPLYGAEVPLLLQELADRAAPHIESARLHHRLLETEERLTTLVDQVLMAQEIDRRRVAYDIHDGLAQIATSVYQHLEAFADNHAWEPSERIELERTQLLARRAIREARRVIAQLRPTVLDEFGLAAALTEEIDGLRALGLDITFENSAPDPNISRAAAVALFRIAQEALTNARKYAGPAPIRVWLGMDGANLRLEVEDEGRGFDPSQEEIRHGPGERVGLAGIRERMALLGGTCSVWSKPGVGTRIAVELPLATYEGASPNVDSIQQAPAYV